MFLVIFISAALFLLAYGYIIGLERLLVEQRWIFVCFFLMPVSVIFELFLKIRNWLVFYMRSAPLLHQQRVDKVIKEVQKWQSERRSTKMCTSRPGWMTVSLRVGRYMGLDGWLYMFKGNCLYVDHHGLNGDHHGLHGDHHCLHGYHHCFYGYHHCLHGDLKCQSAFYIFGLGSGWLRFESNWKAI